ncbi:MAG: TonB-dependent receptor [Bacteroidales bacterium]|nr:TonB-dependent receptor [Bacteroidales bacterium]
MISLKKILGFWVIAKLFPALLFCQSYGFNISGYISDSLSSERLTGATIFDHISKTGTICNEFGYFHLNHNSDTVDLEISYVGYKTNKKQFKPSETAFQNIKLHPYIELEEVMISAKGIVTALPGFEKLSMIEIKSIPLIFGEPDVLKAVQLLPSVKSGSEGSSGLFIRGGDDSQTLITLDGVQVINPGHLYGFFSVFNPDAIKDVKVYSGYIPPSFSNGLSGVVDISMKEGNMKRISGNVTMGLLASGFTLEGPIITEKTSFVLTGRRSYIDLIFSPLKQRLGDFDAAGYHFYDLNAKINHIFSNKSRLYFSLYKGMDAGDNNLGSNYLINTTKINSKNISKVNWGNTIANLRWNYLFNEKLFSNLSFSYSEYNSQSLQKDVMEIYNLFNDQWQLSSKSDVGINNSSILRILSSKSDFNFYFRHWYNVNFGFGYSNKIFNPKVNYLRHVIEDGNSEDDTYSIEDIYSTHYYHTYVENRFSFNRHKINLGLIYEGFQSNNNFQSFQPRFLYQWNPSERIHLQLSYVEMTQHNHRISFSNIPNYNDILVPATGIAKPEKSRQLSTSIEYGPFKDFKFRLETYYKYMKNLIEYSDGAFYTERTDWEDLVVSGKGKAYGIELSAEGLYRKLKTRASYCYSRSERQFSGINFGKPFLYKYDRPHDFNIMLNYYLKSRITLNLDWVFMSGFLATLPEGFFSSIFVFRDPDSYVLSQTYTSDLENTSRNNYRVKPYHRMDFSVNYLIIKTKYDVNLSLGVYNLYNRSNTYKVNHELLQFFDNTNLTNYYRSVFTEKSLFPVVPFISCKLTY